MITSFPKNGSFEYTYGQAISDGIVLPTVFHRHEGEFQVNISKGVNVNVSSKTKNGLPSNLKKIPGAENVVDFFNLLKKLQYKADGITPDPNSFLGSMLTTGSKKLDEIKKILPEAGGLIIAPDIKTAEYMRDLIYQIEKKDKPILVHSNIKNPQKAIRSFKRNSNKRWLVSVNMMSEGMDVPRICTIVYVPSALTNLFFRQSVGRAIRKFNANDKSYAYFIMPKLNVLEKYAREIEKEMQAANVQIKNFKKFKSCPACKTKNALGNVICTNCNHKFTKVLNNNYKSCPSCSTLNIKSATVCLSCNHSFVPTFKISLKNTFRDGAIIRGSTYDEINVKKSENISDDVRNILSSFNSPIADKILRECPPEASNEIIKIAKALTNQINQKGGGP